MRTKSSALRAKEEFLALYQDGKFEPGTRIPSESSMAEMLGVSRETWRKALGLLRGDGIVYSRHGSGTYLTEKRHRIANDLSQLKSLSRMIAEAGLVEEGSSMTCTVGPAPAEVAGFYGLPEQSEFVILQHIRRTVEQVMVVSLAYLPERYADRLAQQMPQSLFQFLEQTTVGTENYAFDEGAANVLNTTIFEDVTKNVLKVHYAKDENGDGTPDYKENKYTITYAADAPDGEVTGLPKAVPGVLAGTKQTVSAVKPTREGYTFSGWTTTDVEVKDDKTFTMPAKNVTFTAQWAKDENATKKASYSVEYYKDGEEVVGDTQTVQQKIWVGDNILTVNKEAINTTDKYAGYVF